MTWNQRLPVRLRRDLRAQRVDLCDSADWVVKDPLSRNFYYFSDAEYSILQLLDGSRSWRDVLIDLKRHLGSVPIDPDCVVRFIADAKSKGLVETAHAETYPPHRDGDFEPGRYGDRRPGVPAASASSATVGGDSSGRAWWHQPLAIRLPGIYPDRFFDRFFGPQSWLAGWDVSWRTSVFWLAAFWLIALAIVAAHADALASELGRLATAPPPDRWLLFLGCVATLKVLHEIGHAVACKRLGGECREIGVMFLLGIPCLYCDVSDAWMIPNRWKRILISAAGMVVELVLASLALMLWVLMAPGPWRDIALMMVVIGSVNTVFINGNPLLRYDGYFIFSDLIRLPNLAQEATERLRHVLRRVLWGRTVAGEDHAGYDDAGRRSFVTSTPFLVGYALASAAYRTTTILVIVYAVYRATTGHGLGWLAAVLGLGLVGRSQLLWWKSVCRRPGKTDVDRRQRLRRVVILGAVVFFLFSGLGVGLAMPFSRTLSVPMVTRPANPQELYVTVAGRVLRSVAPGESVRQGDVVIELVNESIHRESKALETTRDQLAARLQAVKLKHGQSVSNSAEVAAIESALAAVDQRLRWQRQQIDQLTVRAPRDGVIYVPSDFRAANTFPAASTDGVLDDWGQTGIGSPLAPENRGAYLKVGVLVGILGEPQRREAVLTVDQSQVQWVRAGQAVRLLRNDWEPRLCEGRVRDVDWIGNSHDGGGASPGGRNALAEMPAAPPSTAHTSDRTYRVIVDMTEPERGDMTESGEAGSRMNRITIPVGSQGLARISVQPMSLLERFRQTLSQAFALP